VNERTNISSLIASMCDDVDLQSKGGVYSWACQINAEKSTRGGVLAIQEAFSENKQTHHGYASR
jgi:hypothetical protein